MFAAPYPLRYDKNTYLCYLHVRNKVLELRSENVRAWCLTDW